MIYGLNRIKDQELRQKISYLLKSEQYSQAFSTTDYSVVQNPVGVYPRFDIYPLPIPRLKLLPKLDIVLMDMDGTTTTTEVLCLHALETLVSKLSGDPDMVLDRVKDYPHIIGDSTTKHIEYLVAKYRASFSLSATKAAFLEAVSWNIKHAKDSDRKKEANATKKLFLAENPTEMSSMSQTLLLKIGIEIYYQRYHFILSSIDKGESDALSAALTDGQNLIEPMDGIAIFLVFIKGWLGDEIDFVQDYFGLSPTAFKKLKSVASKFADHETKVGLVTSSTSYEAAIVLSQVFVLIRKEISDWPISSVRKKDILAKFKSYTSYYDTVITASDSNEIRLKPHRDLYGIALRNLDCKPSDTVLGFEDSEPGILALRAAGISYAVAVPFEHTKGHDVKAAWKVAAAGAKSVLFDDLLYLES